MNLYQINSEILGCVDAETGEIFDVEKFEELSLERDKVIEKYKEEHFKAALTQFEKIARNLWD